MDEVATRQFLSFIYKFKLCASFAQTHQVAIRYNQITICNCCIEKKNSSIDVTG